MTARLLSDVAELGLEAVSTSSFERELLAALIRDIGSDGGCVHVTDAAGRTTIETLGHPKPKELALIMALSEIEADELVKRAVQETVRVTPFEPQFDKLTWFHSYRRIQARSVIGRLLVADSFVMGISLTRSKLAPFTADDVRTLDGVFPIVKIAEELQRRRASARTEPEPGTTFGLGGREAQVTALVCKGLQNPEIAQLLGLSRNTVRNILVNVFRKLGATTRSELVMLCAGAEGLRSPASLIEGLRQPQNPARGFLQSVLECARPLGGLPQPPAPRDAGAAPRDDNGVAGPDLTVRLS